MFGADATFDLSDHCDFDELGEVVERSGADQVYTVHGYRPGFARHLHGRKESEPQRWRRQELALALWRNAHPDRSTARRRSGSRRQRRSAS
jgi:hypothetical protein